MLPAILAIAAMGVGMSGADGWSDSMSDRPVRRKPREIDHIISTKPKGKRAKRRAKGKLL